MIKMIKTTKTQKPKNKSEIDKQRTPRRERIKLRTEQGIVLSRMWRKESSRAKMQVAEQSRLQ